MDAKFLESACEAYIINNNLFQQVTVETLFKDIYKSLYHIREYDKELYNEIYKYSRINQQLLINEYFDIEYKKEEVLEEMEILVGNLTLILIAALITMFSRKKFSKSIFKTLSSLGTFFDNVGKFISKHSRYWKFRYAMLQKNSKQAYIKCGINPDEISFSHYLNIKDELSKLPFANDAETVKKANCLREAYINTLIDEIELFLKSYFVCLKSTGNFQKIENADPKNIATIISTTKVSNVCLEYYKFVKEIIKKFEDVLDYVYVKDTHKKQEKINILINRINKVKNEVKNTKNFKKYK